MRWRHPTGDHAVLGAVSKRMAAGQYNYEALEDVNQIQNAGVGGYGNNVNYSGSRRGRNVNTNTMQSEYLTSLRYFPWVKVRSELFGANGIERLAGHSPSIYAYSSGLGNTAEYYGPVTGAADDLDEMLVGWVYTTQALKEDALPNGLNLLDRV